MAPNRILARSPIRSATAAGAVGEADLAQRLPQRENFKLAEHDCPALAVQVQRPHAALSRADVIYVHGATFGADLSVFFAFDGRSWADALAGAGFTVWGFDFAGFGRSDRYPASGSRPAGDLADAMAQLRRVVAEVRRRNGRRPIVLLAHSRGGAVAARYAGEFPAHVQALVLFAPFVTRPASALDSASAGAASHYPLTVWAQYRRFIEDVPRGQPQVLSDAHIQAWSSAFLASEPGAASRALPAVTTPYGPVTDILAMWSGKALYEPSRIVAPTLLVRGEWDSLCNDADAARLMGTLGAQVKMDAKIERATHLMHLEQQRGVLYDQVNRFLSGVLK
jgi:alpha-beta hydrolase superfamily lysophospholipase